MPYCAYCGNPVDAVSFAPCTACGNPTNGAPSRRAAGGSGGLPVLVIVLIVGLGFVVIVGILAAIAIPNLLTAMERSKQKRSMVDMLTISTSVEAYAVDNGNHYPEATSVDQLATSLTPKYIKVFPRLDGWGHPYRYECWNMSGSGPCDAYVVASAGKDMKFEVEDFSKFRGRGETTNFHDDIVFENGDFVQFPFRFNTSR